MSHSTKANGKSNLHVNGHLITAALTARHLTIREAARRTGLTFNILNRITRANSYSADLPLRYLLDLCDLCDLDLTDVLDLAEAYPAPHFSTNAPEPDTMVEVVLTPAQLERFARYMLMNSFGAEPGLIAVVFGWTLRELHQARRLLNNVIEQLGVTCVHANDRYYLTTTSRQRSETLRDAADISALTTCNRPLTAGQARMLSHALEGTWPNTLRDGERPALGHTVTLGLLTPTADGDHQPSAALLDAFCD